MTLRQKNEIIAEVIALLDRMIIIDDNPKPQISVTQNSVVEMQIIRLEENANENYRTDESERNCA